MQNLKNDTDFLTYELISAASFSPISIKFPVSWCGHIPFAAWIINEINPGIFVELGTHTGNSYFSFCQSALKNSLNTKCYAVDSWIGDIHAGEYEDAVFTSVNKHNQEFYSGFSSLLRMRFDDAVTYFSDESIHLLHIDGLHTYEAVLHDYINWLPKLAPGAVIMFHDINVRERNFGVWKLWEELQQIHTFNIEFTHSHGLGVLQIGNVSEDRILPLFKLNQGQKKTFKNYFFSLGNSIKNNETLQEIKRHNEQLLQNNNVKLDNLGQKVDVLAGELDAIKSSSSWRITAPFRIAVNKVKWIQIYLSLLLKKIRFRLGLANRDSAVSMLHPATQDSTGHDENDYSEWIRRYDTLTDKKRMYMRKCIENLSSKPSISIIMPTYNPKIEWLMAAIDSVKKQIYPYWELCIADDASTDAAIRTILEKYAKEDSRIKVVFREKNGHISAATNSAVDLASHPWLALMDHDDVLAEHALYYVADVIDKNGHIKLIYSDEDKIDLNGNRCHPYFKCDWNVNLFLSQNLITHIGVYRSDIARDIGGFRLGYEGAQDYDFALRYIERIESSQIYHIPRILYHWRSHENSTAQSLDAKPYGLIAGEKALNDYFLRNHIAASVTVTDYGYRTSYSITGQYPKVSVIIPTRNALDLLKQCIESILEKTSYPNYEVLIIDNGSDDEATLKYLKTIVLNPRIQVLLDDGPFNYSALNNAAVEKAAGEYVLLLNNDIEVISSEWMGEMVSIAIQPHVGVVGARLWYPDNTLQHGGVILGIGGVAGHAHKHLPVNRSGYFSRAQLIQSVSAVTAACLLVRKEIYTEVGGLDEINLKVAFNDVDFCLRVRQVGYRNIWTPYAELYHHESATRGHENTPEKKERFQNEAQFMSNQWSELLLSDPAYNPNLSLNSESFSLAWPPRIDSLNVNE